MDKFQAMRVFTRVVECNSFSAAADSLQMPRSSVTTLIQQLESYLKVRLLNRTTRRMRVTPDGAAYYERCVRILGEVEDSEVAFSTLRSPRGKLKVDVPGPISRLAVVPALHEFQSRYPEIDLLLGVNDKPIDLVKEGVDCAIRTGYLPDSALIAKRVGASDLVTVASHGYLAQFGEPSTLADLNAHAAVYYFSGRGGRIVELGFKLEGKSVRIPMRSKLAVNDDDTYLHCGLQGLGLIQIPHFLAFEHLRAGNLVEVLDRWRAPPFPIWAIYPQSRHLSPHVRVFVEWIEQQFDGCHLLRKGAGRPRVAGPVSVATVSDECDSVAIGHRRTLVAG
jgi:LysR family transcriptional regulator, regulator for bpeEF and oprC